MDKNYIDITSDYLRSSGSKEKTINVYLYFIKKYLGSLGNNHPENSTSREISSFLSELNKEYSSKSLALAFSSLSFFYKNIVKKPEILLSIELPKKDSPHALSKEEIKSLINSTETKKSRLIISFLYSTGVKVSELVNLKLTDLDLEKKQGMIQGENNKSHPIFLSQKLCDDLKKYLEEKTPQIFLFSKKESPLTTRNIQKIIKNTAKKAGLEKKVTPYSLRNSFASHLLESGIESKTINQLLGHSKNITHEFSDIINPLDNL